MARKPRIGPQVEFQHITNRGARRSNIYGDDIDRDVFLELIAKAHSKFGFVLHAYALMGNHYHLVAQFPDRNMSQVMHWIGMNYSIAINRKYGFDGRLCKDRFFNSPIENDSYLLQAVRYVHQNPKDLGVRDLEAYEWSSYGMYLKRAYSPDWLRTDLVLDLFGGNLESFRAFTNSTPSEDFPSDRPLAS